MTKPTTPAEALGLIAKRILKQREALHEQARNSTNSGTTPQTSGEIPTGSS